MRARTFSPRPEYPRPDRQRGFVSGVDWLNLNGPWEFQFDPEDKGLGEKWFEPGPAAWPDQIIVPFCWESLAAWGEAEAAGNDNYFSTRAYRNPLEVTSFNYRNAARYEVGWYRRVVTIPSGDSWRDKRVILTVGAADFFTRAWCNGVALGSNEGGFTPFEFDLTDALSTQPNGVRTATIVFRVEDSMQNSDQPVGKQWGWYSSASGIWQTVFLEPRARIFIERFEITTDIESARARFRIFVSGGSTVHLKITSPSGEIFTHEARIEAGLADAEVALGLPILWDPNNPLLYRLTIELPEDGQSDIVHSYFGVRTLAAQPVAQSSAPAALALNGEPIYLRGALYQSYHPDGVYTAGDVRAIQEDILQAKQAGFDLLRIHIKVDDPLVLYYADTLGILLMADFPNFGEGGDTETGRRRYEEMMRRTIERDFNHPSIVAWCLFNETWGFGGQTEFVKLINPAPPVAATVDALAEGPALQRAYLWVQSMWRLAKALDPTRLVEDMSVVPWDHLEHYGHGDTDMNSWHFYSKSYELARRQIDEVVEKTYAGSTFNYVPGFHQGSQPLINSEYGGVGALDGDIDTSWSFKFLTNELRRHGKISAYIYTELHDVEWERNGFLNYDRTPKEFGYDPTIVNQGDVLPIDAAPVTRCVPGEEVTVPVFSSHFSRKRRHNVTLHWSFGGLDSFGQIHEDLAHGSEAIHFGHLQLEPAKTLRLRMPDETMLCTLWVRAFEPDGTLVASNYVQFFVESEPVSRVRVDGRTILRLNAHSWSAAEWNHSFSSREDAAIADAASGTYRGFFEWKFPVTDEDLAGCSRLTVLCEASSCRAGAPQTDAFAQPTVMKMLLNGVQIHRGILPNHPHDSRGVLSYLRGAQGGYGYLCRAKLEREALSEIFAQRKGNHLRLRCVVPRTEQPQGGLTVYGAAAGRYPLGPTLIFE